MGRLQDVCVSDHWTDDELSGLGLLGLQPCFEDVILLSPIYVAMIAGGLYRSMQCYRYGRPFKHTQRRKIFIYVNIACSLCNFISNLVLVSVLKGGAPYEYLVIPLGLLAWLSIMCMNIVSLKYFSFAGQWISRFLGLWVFVCHCIRWPSQYALGYDVSGQEYYFQTFIAMWVPQAVSVAIFYFGRMVSYDEWIDQAPPGVEATTEIELAEASQPRGHMSFTATRAAQEDGSTNAYKELRVASIEPDRMRSVPWTDERNPEGNANFISRALFCWMSPLFSYAHKNDLEDYDVWDLRDRFRCANSHDLFARTWEQERSAVPETRYLKSPLLRTLIRCYFWNIFPSAPLLLLQNVAQLVLPFLIGPLIQFMDNDAPLYLGYVYSGALFIALMVMTVSENLYFDICTKTGILVKGGLIPAIYRHAMRMTSEARQERSAGAIANHMSSDTEKIQMFCMSVNNLWSSPVRLGLGLFLLINALGVSGIFGLISVVLLIPVQAEVMKKFSMYFKEVMKKSDIRIKILNEVLGGMRVIKYYAWEKPFEEKVRQLRGSELESLGKSQAYRAINLFFINLNPVALSVGTFIAYAAFQGNLDPAQAFQALALFNLLVWPLMLFPRTVSEYLEVQVSLDRIEGYLLSSIIEDIQMTETPATDNEPKKSEEGLIRRYKRVLHAPPEVKLEGASFTWRSDAPPVLICATLNVRPGELLAVVGTTGSGKSSLISSIIGELKILVGEASLCGSVAYVPQQAWIFNATVRENILFGLPFDEERYRKAIDVSGLRADIEKQFEGGDQTEIGEKGVNLSGGQRQRVSIARAVYADADIYLFDDPLSALDAHVTAEVFKKCIKEHLAEKTVILVANQMHLMSEVDRIAVMKGGRLVEIGTFRELMARETGEFYRLKMEGGEADDDSEDDKTKENDSLSVETPSVTLPAVLVRNISTHDVKAQREIDLKESSKKDAGKLVQKEGHTVGSVKSDVYIGYFDAIGKMTFWAMIISCVISVALSLASATWLGIWSEGGAGENRSVFFYISIYVALSLATVIFVYLSNALGFSGAVNASASMHYDFVHGLMRAPISFFDSTPLGRITNRLAKDMGQVDTIIMFNFQLFLRSVVNLVGTIVIIGINTTYVLVPFVPILTLFAGVQNYFRSTSVQLKRLEAVSRSPVYAHFSESLGGMATIRAFVAQDRMALENIHKLDENMRIYLLSMSSNRWLSIRLEFLGGLLILATAINVVILRNSLSAASAGIALAYALQITAQLNLLVRMVTEMEGSFNAVERVQEYTAIKSEAALEGPEHPPKDWPSEGRVELRNLVVSYREGLEPVLKGLSVIIEPGMKVGVCGRTGAGKSSLFQALFRMMEASEGSILFDGIDISKLGLSAVRNAISIIPQEPIVFSGTLRFNLDPFDQYSDAELWNALERASLKDYLMQKGEGLNMKVLEGGDNFSVGQRQLVCLARALLRKSKILVLDEATANVDVETDALIQKTIRENFSDRTCLTIAHRLNTIIDCDKILVLEFGRVKEYDTPKALLLNPRSEFYSMVEETGPKNAAYLKEIAIEGAVVADDTLEALAAAGKAKILTTMNNRFENMGPLMKAVEAASNTLRSGWEDRRKQEWVEELEKHERSIQEWMMYMSELLGRIGEAADAAFKEEHLEHNVGMDIKGMLAANALSALDANHSSI